MANPYLMAGMAAASMLSSHSKQRAAMKAAVEDAKLQRAKLERARQRQAGDFATNTQRMREAAQDREIQIEQERIRAESKVDEVFAGSGISGTSVDELDNEIIAQVSANKFKNKKTLDQQLADQSRADRQFADDSTAQARNIGVGPRGSSTLDNVLTGAQGAVTGAQLSESLGIN